MKVTNADKELADRFPSEKSGCDMFDQNGSWYGKNASDAKVSPQQLDRLLNLGLIKMAPNGDGYCGGSHGQKPGKGWTRKVTGFVKVIK